jgi:ribosomal protein L11 methyltransferase
MWTVRLPCTKMEADALDCEGDAFAEDGITLTAVLMEEPKPERWYLEAFCPEEPDTTLIARLRSLTSSEEAAEVARLPDTDWVTLSQAGLAPISAGRFYIYSSYYEGSAPPGSIALRIEAAQAFGTGTHVTTSGCLQLLDRLGKSKSYRNILDLGTGTGILAFAAARLWPRARILASDIDPVAVEVAQGFARANALSGRVALLAAPGLQHPALRRHAPYDLLLANILAGPLITLAPELARAVAPGGHLILAGLLDTQEQAVDGAYRAAGFQRVARLQQGDWTCLLLRRR